MFRKDPACPYQPDQRQPVTSEAADDIFPSRVLVPLGLVPASRPEGASRLAIENESTSEN